MKKIAVAIDGPGGAGKSTISKEIAKRLGIIYVDTGALYRTVGYFIRENGLSVADSKVSELVTPLLDKINIEIAYVDGAQHVILNGEDLGDKIDASDRADVNAAIEKLKETVKTDNIEAIKADTEALEKTFYKISEKLYAQQQAQGADPNAGAQGQGSDGTYYNANFEDHSDNK